MAFQRMVPILRSASGGSGSPPPSALTEIRKQTNVTVPAPFVIKARPVAKPAVFSPTQPVQRKTAQPARAAFATARAPFPMTKGPKVPAAFSARLVQRASSSTSSSSSSDFIVDGISFAVPANHQFTTMAAEEAILPIPRGEAKKETGRSAASGVSVGQIGSYGYVQYLEKTGDGLTGDHQPSGAAVKEAIRLLLHPVLPNVLTRLQARNAYQKAITIIMTDLWHKSYSRTYGGRNTSAQIGTDAANLANAAVKDWQTTVAGLKNEGLSQVEIEVIWKVLSEARELFFATGKAQAGSL